MRHRFLLLLTLTFLLAACSQRTTTQQLDLNEQFGSYTGSFKLYDLTAKTYSVYHEEKRDQRYAPASTFKVLHSLIALETGVVQSAETVIPWDGSAHSIPAWNRDQTLRSAVSDSVIWYFQRVATDIGRDREEHYLQKVGYGNQKVGPDVTTFWLDGSLAVSVDDQLAFITRFYQEELPFDKSVIQTVKQLITLRQDPEVTFAGKTGSAVRVTPNIGWFIGYIVTEEKPYTFVTRLEGDGVTGAQAKEVTEKVLRKLGHLK